MFTAKLLDYQRQLIASERMAIETLNKARDQYRAEGFRLAEFTNMFERWVHPDGRERIIE
jgi:hypothetical protein